MNRYTATGILIDVAVLDRRVLAVMDNMRSVREALRSLEAVAHELGFDAGVLTIRRANGQEQVTAKGGGRVDLIAASGNGGRGMHADVLYIDEPRDLGERRLADLMPCVIGGDVVYGR